MAHAAFNPDTSDMKDIAIKFNGNIAQIANHFNVSRETIYQYLKRNPDGKKLIESVRGINTETILDSAEFVYMYALNQYKSSLRDAIRAAEKVIDKKGHLRGWGNNDQNIPPNVEAIESTFNQIDAEYKIKILERKIDELKRKTDLFDKGSEQAL